MSKDLLKDFRREKRKREIKAKLNSAVVNSLEWIDEHKEIIATVVPVAVSGTVTLTKVASKCRKARREAAKDLQYYDRSLNYYWKLRRSLTNDEAILIKERKMKGESLGDILASMRLLK